MPIINSFVRQYIQVLQSPAAQNRSWTTPANGLRCGRFKANAAPAGHVCCLRTAIFESLTVQQNQQGDGIPPKKVLCTFPALYTMRLLVGHFHESLSVTLLGPN